MKLTLVLTLLFFHTAFAKETSTGIEIMTYNVENLFDAVHDKGKNDWTYLPFSKQKSRECQKVKSKYRRNECFETDWTEKKVELKLKQIRKVLLEGERKSLPQILGLIEVENPQVVSKLAKSLGYEKFVMTNSPDKRGIDVALLWNPSKDLIFKTFHEHELKGDYFKKKPSRNILEVEFQVANSESLYVFVNHWPSLGNPDNTRVQAATLLKSRIEKLQKANSKAGFIAMGDFNTIPKLKKKSKIHPFRDIFLKDSIMVDLRESYLSSESVPKSLKMKQPPGTYYYKRGKVWNQLDRVFFSKNLLTGNNLKIDLNSFEVYAPSFSRKSETKGYKGQLAPYRFDHKAKTVDEMGYSDHFPIVFKLNYK